MRVFAKSALLWSFMLAIAATTAASARDIHWEKCQPGQPNTPEKTCVVDGDTIWLEGVNIRLEGYDTPEPQTNICGGEREKALATQASNRLVTLLNSHSWKLKLLGEQGNYGRELGKLYFNGRNVGEILVKERLARWWPDGEEWWCY